MTRRTLLARTVAFFLALPLVARLKPVKAAPLCVEPPKVLCRMVGGPYDGQQMRFSETSTQFMFPINHEIRAAWANEGAILLATPMFRAGAYDRVDATTFVFRESSWPDYPEVKRGRERDQNCVRGLIEQTGSRPGGTVTQIMPRNEATP